MSELIISTQSNLTETDQALLDFYMSKVEQAKNGQIGAKKVYADLYIMLKSLEELRDEIKDQVIDELSQYDKREAVECNGFVMKTQSKRTFYYSHDPAWVIINEKRKAREALMKKALIAIDEFFDEETGEVIPEAEVKFSTFIKMEAI